MVRRRYHGGERVRLVRTDDAFTRLSPGDLGTVDREFPVDDAGTVHVTWDNGEHLGLLPDLDQWEDVEAEG
jgi:hypothetical protein